MSGNIPTFERIGWPIHQISFGAEEANVSRSFGPDLGELRPGREGAILQTLASSGNGGFWSADRYRYRLTHWDATGRKLRTYERAPSWFHEPSPSGGIGSPTKPPPPSISSIQEDNAGRLWVFVRLAAEKWREAWLKIPPGSRDIAVKDISLDKLFRTTVEVLDDRNSRVIARVTIDGWILASMPSNRAAVYSMKDNGTIHIRIVQLLLNEQ
jgi:hypothetical protein